MTSSGGAGPQAHLAAHTNLVPMPVPFQYIHIPEYRINTSAMVSDCCILFAQAPVMFVFSQHK